MESVEEELKEEAKQEEEGLDENVVIKEEPRDTEETLDIPEDVAIKEEPQEPKVSLAASENVVIKEEPPDVEEEADNAEEPTFILHGNWNELGLKEEDLQRLKDGKIDELSDEGKQRLKDLNITEDMIADALLTTIQQEAVEHSEDLEELEAKERASEIPESPKKTIVEYLLEKKFSVNFIQALLNAGLTDEALKFFKSLFFTEDEISTIEMLLEIEKNKVEIDSLLPGKSTSGEYLSSNGLYLKHYLSGPLIEGLRETIARRPVDPVEYLAHWLLNYRECERRSKRQKEFDLALQIEREKIRRQDLQEQVSLPTDRQEEASVQEDSNFVDYRA